MSVAAPQTKVHAAKPTSLLTNQRILKQTSPVAVPGADDTCAHCAGRPDPRAGGTTALGVPVAPGLQGGQKNCAWNATGGRNSSSNARKTAGIVDDCGATCKVQNVICRICLNCGCSWIARSATIFHGAPRRKFHWRSNLTHVGWIPHLGERVDQDGRGAYIPRKPSRPQRADCPGPPAQHRQPKQQERLPCSGEALTSTEVRRRLTA
jgi:hypothetical protein